MKKRCVKFLNNAMYLMLFCMSLMLSGCGFNTTSYSNIDAVNTVVDLSNADYEIIETVTGESKQTYVFGIGGLSKRSLTENAKADMYKNANLTANEAIIYPSVTTSVASYLGIVTNIRAVASGYKIRFKRDIAKSETTDILANKKEDLSKFVDVVESKELTKVTAKFYSEDKDFIVELSDGGNFKMLYVEGGRFNMGCTGNQVDYCTSDELPAHNIVLSDFCIGETEITQKVWESIMGKSIHKQVGETVYKGACENCPIYFVNYDEAIEFCKQLNLKLASQLPSGYKFDLPSEAQWEYSARGGRNTKNFVYSGSDDLNKVAWYASNSTDVSVVAIKEPNELGLYDMSGNVSEWCKDSYDNQFYSQRVGENPINENENVKKVIRGGDIDKKSKDCRVSDRSFYNQDKKSMNIGLRVALVKK